MKRTVLLCLFLISSFALSMRSEECMYMKEARAEHIIAADVYKKLAWDAFDASDYEGWIKWHTLYEQEQDAADHLDGAMQESGCFN